METSYNKILISFRKQGFIYLKNFLSDMEVDKINNYRKEIISNLSKDHYIINRNNIIQSKLSEKIKKILKKNLENETEIFFKNFIDLKEYFINNKLVSSNEIDKNNYLKFNLHVAFSNSKATNYSHDSDILLNDITSKIFLKDELINIYQILLNSKKLIYWGESGFTYNKPPVRGWHSDDPLHTQYKKNEETFQIRVALYPDSNPNQSGGIKILPTSHKYNSPLQALKNFVKYTFLKNEMYKNTYKLINFFQFQKNIFPSKGDIIIWDKRLMHSPWSQMFKFFNFGFLHPSIENFLPNNFFVPPCFPRSILSFDIGKKSSNLDTYLYKWISVREEYKDYWNTRQKFKKKEYIDFLNKRLIEFKDIGCS